MLQKKRTLTDLQNAAEFIARHVGPSADDQQQMLSALGCTNLQQLTAQVVPEAIAMAEDLAIVDGCTEAQALASYVKSPAITGCLNLLLGRAITALSRQTLFSVIF